LVCTVSAQDLSETRVKVIELEPDLEPVPLATLLANKWLTCDVSDVVDLRTITNTTTDIDDFDYGSPDGTFEHPPLRRTSRTTWQLMSALWNGKFLSRTEHADMSLVDFPSRVSVLRTTCSTTRTMTKAFSTPS